MPLPPRVFRFALALLSLWPPALLPGQPDERITAAYLASIRDQQAALTDFFRLMPKGGDLHHHYHGSVATETFVENALEMNLWVNTRTLALRNGPRRPTPAAEWKRLSALSSQPGWSTFRQRLLRMWSVKDYARCTTGLPPDEHFFNTFPMFDLPANARIDKGLAELKARALAENVQYLETIFIPIPCNTPTRLAASYNTRLRKLAARKDYAALDSTLQSLADQLLAAGIGSCAESHNRRLADLHRQVAGDDSAFVLRYQNYVLRVLDPTTVFAQLLTGFVSANSSNLVVGVNIVAPEDDPVAIADYNLHMRMYQFCKRKFPNVRFAMHAGEMTTAQVAPEALRHHIHDAVHTAGASRIGHGVAIPYETDCNELLTYLATNKIPVEINLSSNEFILQVRDGQHPLMLYKNNGVPFVICTDDAGVLRTSLTEQYVLLASRYREIGYEAIKQAVYNSIHYSFLEEPAVKQQLTGLLDRRFMEFERDIASRARLQSERK